MIGTREQLQLAGFDLAEIQDIVDDVNQGLSRAFDVMRARADFARRILLQDQLVHAEDGG